MLQNINKNSRRLKKSVFFFKQSKMHVSVFSFHSGDGVHCGLQPVRIHWESLSAIQVNWLPFLLLSTLIFCFSVIKVFLLICNMRLLYNSQFQEIDTQPFVWFISLENQLQLGEKFGVCCKKWSIEKRPFLKILRGLFSVFATFQWLMDLTNSSKSYSMEKATFLIHRKGKSASVKTSVK